MRKTSSSFHRKIHFCKGFEKQEGGGEAHLNDLLALLRAVVALEEERASNKGAPRRVASLSSHEKTTKHVGAG